MRVAKTGCDFDLAMEPLGAERLSELGAEQLERDPPLMARIIGEVDLAHAACAKSRQDPVAADRVPGGQHRD
jgi:hypothetical protein